MSGDDISSKAKLLFMPPAMSCFDTRRYHTATYNPRDAFTYADERHAVFTNLDTTSPIQALLVSVYHDISGEPDMGVRISAISRDHSDNLLYHRLNFEGFFPLPCTPKSAAMSQHSMQDEEKRAVKQLLARVRMSNTSSIELGERPDMREGLERALSELRLNNQLGIYMVDLLDFSTLSQEVAYLNERGLRVAHEWGVDIDPDAHIDYADALEYELRLFFLGLNNIGFLSADPDTRKPLLIAMAKFIEKNYGSTKLTLADTLEPHDHDGAPPPSNG